MTLEISAASVQFVAIIVLPKTSETDSQTDTMTEAEMDAAQLAASAPMLMNMLRSATAFQDALRAQPDLQAVSVESAPSYFSANGAAGTKSATGHYPGQSEVPYGVGVTLDTKLSIYAERVSVMTDLVSFSYRELPLAYELGGPAYKLFVMQRSCSLSSKDPESCNVGTKQTGLLEGVPFKYAYTGKPAATLHCAAPC